MSIYSGKTGRSSILKAYSPAEREKAKAAIINKVRFEMPKQKGILEAVRAVREDNNYHLLGDYVDFLKESELNDMEFFRIFIDARSIVNDLSPKFTNLVEALLVVPWIKRTAECVQAYCDFCVDLIVVHSKYIQFFIGKLIGLWLPTEKDEALWINGVPSEQNQNELLATHKLLNRILSAIPMSFDVLLETTTEKFPYFKKASYVVAGYLHNLLWLLEYKPVLMEFVLQLVLQKMIILDVNAPRQEIEDTGKEDNDEEDDDDDENEMEDNEEQIFEMDDVCSKEPTEQLPMIHPIAQTLDICMEKVYAFLEAKIANLPNLSEDQRLQKEKQAAQFLQVLLKVFDNVILPSHNTHHVQFLIFYYCSFKPVYAETFLNLLWDKIKNPNVSAVIRQAAVGYVASFLARAKFLPIELLKQYLRELCSFAHKYIQGADQYRANCSLKSNIVFYSTCQAIFYVIAFRSRVLTSDKKNLLFLQSQQLSALVTCHYNPLRVCLPMVATIFAGVTRTYQLAYCHAILERNARRKLATVYANDVATPEETLDTFFPFDPYLLKISGARIQAIYLHYQASDEEEQAVAVQRRKRGDSEMLDDHDVDDFLIADKRQKYLAKSQEREAQFTYGVSPGFYK